VIAILVILLSAIVRPLDARDARRDGHPGYTQMLARLTSSPRRGKLISLGYA
jgi:hypothetical protein